MALTLVTSEQVAGWKELYELGDIWDEASATEREQAVELVELIWHGLRWKSSPFEDEAVRDELLGILVQWSRWALELEGAPTSDVPIGLRRMLKSYLGARVLSMGTTTGEVFTGTGGTGGPGIDSIARAQADTNAAEINTIETRLNTAEQDISDNTDAIDTERIRRNEGFSDIERQLDEKAQFDSLADKLDTDLGNADSDLSPTEQAAFRAKIGVTSSGSTVGTPEIDARINALRPNPFTDADETKLDGIEAGAQVNVGSEFTAAEKTKLGSVQEGARAVPAADSIETNMLKDDAVTDRKIAAESVASGHLKSASVTERKIENDAVTTRKIAEDTIEQGHMQNDSVGTAELKADNVTEAKLSGGVRTKLNTPRGLSSSQTDDRVYLGIRTTIPYGHISLHPNTITLQKDDFPERFYLAIEDKITTREARQIDVTMGGQLVLRSLDATLLGSLNANNGGAEFRFSVLDSVKDNLLSNLSADNFSAPVDIRIYFTDGGSFTHKIPLISDNVVFADKDTVPTLGNISTALGLPAPGAANRGKWIERKDDDTGFQYVDEPSGGGSGSFLPDLDTGFTFWGANSLTGLSTRRSFPARNSAQSATFSFSQTYDTGIVIDRTRGKWVLIQTAGGTGSAATRTSYTSGSSPYVVDIFVAGISTPTTVGRLAIGYIDTNNRIVIVLGDIGTGTLAYSDRNTLQGTVNISGSFRVRTQGRLPPRVENFASSGTISLSQVTLAYI